MKKPVAPIDVTRVVEFLRCEAQAAWHADDPFLKGYLQALRDILALANPEDSA